MLCFRCGSHNPDGSEFCSQCGQKFADKDKAPSKRQPDADIKIPPRKTDLEDKVEHRPGEHIADRYEIGKEKEHEIALRYKDWCYTTDRQKKLTDPGYLLQCMPVDRGHEAAPEVCDNELSWIYDQAENRLHTQKAIMTLTMGGRL